VSVLIIGSVNPIQANIVMMNDSAMLDLHVPPIDVICRQLMLLCKIFSKSLWKWGRLRFLWKIMKICSFFCARGAAGAIECGCCNGVSLG
jgi:hypothetical protein